MKQHLKFNYVLGILAILVAIFNLIGLLSNINTSAVLGIIYFLMMAFFLFKKPVVGYFLLGIAVVLFIVMLIIYRYINQY